jgi:hypothetical protein
MSVFIVLIPFPDNFFIFDVSPKTGIKLPRERVPIVLSIVRLLIIFSIAEP